MTDPNSSLLAQFDPICNVDSSKATPARLAMKKGGDTLTLSTFFNRINSQQQVPAPSIAAPNNRGSLIDISFNFGEIKAAALDQITPTKHRRQQPSSVVQTQDDAENLPLQITRPSPRKQRNAYPLPSPSKSTLSDSPSKSSHARRSSLDLSALTLDIKHRLAAENMSFDILRDEVSFLTNTVEEEHSSTTAPNTHSEQKSITTRTAGQKDTSAEVTMASDPKRLKRRNLELALPPPLSLPMFDFEKERSSSIDVKADSAQSSTPTQSEFTRKPRKSVFDAVENTPTASANTEIPNIVTSWDDPPKVRPLSLARPSRHLRTASSTAAARPGNSMFKVPLPTVRPSTRSPPQTAAAPTSPEKLKTTPTDAEVIKRASSLRTVASSIINKDRGGITKASRTVGKIDDVKSISSSSVSTLLRRSKTTISSGLARQHPEPATTHTAVKPRPSSLMLRRPGVSNDSRSSQSPQPSEPSHESSGALVRRGRMLERTASVQTITSQQPSRTKGETLTTEQRTYESDNQSSNRVRDIKRGHFPSNASIRSKFTSEAKKDEERARSQVNGIAAAHETDPEPRTNAELAKGAPGLVRKRSHRGQPATSSGILHETKTLTAPSVVNSGRNKENTRSRRTETPDGGNQDVSSTVTRSTKTHSRAMQRPRLDGLREWAAGVEAATARALPEAQPVAETQPKLTSGLVRKRSLKEPSSAASAISAPSLRRTKTTAQFSSETNTDAERSRGTSSGTLRPRTSIYSLAYGSKMAASVEVLPLAAPAPAPSGSKTSAAGHRSRPASIYSSKIASASTPAVNEPPSQSGRTAVSTATSTSTRSTLLRRPSITSATNPAIAPTSTPTTAKSLSRISASLLRSKSRVHISAR